MVAVVLSLIFLWPVQAIAQGEQDAGPTDVAGLEEAFGVADIRSDYVVVIDTSGSMSQGPAPLFPQVETAYSGLVDAIPDGDRLTLITFDGTTEVRPNIEVSPSTRDAARQLPPADGEYTDIGAALNAAVDALDQPDAAAIQTVIFITDGIAQPRPGSPFDPVGSPAWVRARERAAALEARRTISVRALGLTDAGKQGADLAGQVFGTPVVVRVTSDQLRDYLTTEVRNARRRVLERSIQKEIDDGRVEVDVRPQGGLGDEVEVAVELRSTLEHLGVEVDLDSVQARDFNGDPVRSSIVGGSRTLKIEPGGSATFEVLVKPSVESPPLFSLPPRQREEIDVSLDLSQSARAMPVTLLDDDLGIDTSVAVDAADPFTLGRDTGKPWGRFLLEVLAALVAVAVLYRLWWRFIRKPRLFGALVPHGALEGGAEIPLRGKKMIVDGSAFGMPGKARVKLFTRRGRPGAVYVDRIGLDGSLERGVSTRWLPVESGTPLGVATYRLDGDMGPKFRWRRGEEEE